MLIKCAFVGHKNFDKSMFLNRIMVQAFGRQPAPAEALMLSQAI
jgi:hypothetical protein